MDQELLPRWIQTVPDGSKRELPLAKADSVSYTSCASRITCLRNILEMLHSSCKRGVRKWKSKSPTDTKIREEGRGLWREPRYRGCLPSLSPQPITHRGLCWSNLHSAAPGKPHITVADVAWRMLQPVESLCREQAPGRSCSTWKRAHGGAGGLAGSAAHGRGETHWGSLFLKDCTTWEEPMLEQFWKICSLWEGP